MIHIKEAIIVEGRYDVNKIKQLVDTVVIETGGFAIFNNKEKQQEENEQIYREAAIKKQIEILQNKLDEMHPENVTDIRKFEMKIEKAGMNETAEKEAKK